MWKTIGSIMLLTELVLLMVFPRAWIAIVMILLAAAMATGIAIFVLILLNVSA